MRYPRSDRPVSRVGEERTQPGLESGIPAEIDSQFQAERGSTGTVDDDDEPEDEHDGENEASERETRDDTEAPEEFERDDEDRSTISE